jgi:hypothetical protein
LRSVISSPVTEGFVIFPCHHIKSSATIHATSNLAFADAEKLYFDLQRRFVGLGLSTNWSFVADKKTGLSKRAAAVLSTGKGIAASRVAALAPTLAQAILTG